MIANPISRDALLQVVKTLPAAPRILSQLCEMLLDMTSDMDDFARLLKRDLAMTARLIRISNSALYNSGHPHTSIEEALACVGFMEVYRLTGFAAAAQLADQHLPFYGVTGEQLRRNALVTALLMEALAPTAQVDRRLAYTAGLLRSTGKIAFDRLARGLGQRPVLSGPDGDGLVLREMDFAGFSNADAAAVILGDWRFPTVIVEAIRDQYLIGQQSSPLAPLLNIAAAAAERAGHGLPGESRYLDFAVEKYLSARVNEPAVHEATLRALETFEAVAALVA